MDPHSRAAKKNTSHGNEVLDNHATTEEICAKIHQSIGPHENLLPIEKRRKLKSYGHVFRLSVLAKTILRGTVEKGQKTRQTEKEVGRQLQGMDRPGVRHVPEGNGKQRNWRKLVVKSYVVPQRPLRLRDR